jgi:1,4-dihydroxy-2-naphthoate octaprenyltransferase
MKTLNFSMWIKAIRVIPRLKRDEFDKLDFVSKWLIITRSAVFVMTFISASIAGIFAIKYDMFNFNIWFLTTLGLIFAHATNNLVNDFVDHLKGVDKGNYFRVQYGPHPFEDNLMDFKEILKYVVVTGLIALLIGIYLVNIRKGIAIPLIIIGSFFVLFYTFPLKYIGLGELSVLLVWGPLMVGGAYFIITGIVDKNVIIASFPYAIGVTTVLFGKHIDKFDFDKQKGIKTFPVLIGKKIRDFLFY